MHLFILKYQVEHPAARMLIFASQMQEQEVGDSTNTVIILASSLLEHAEELIRMVFYIYNTYLLPVPKHICTYLPIPFLFTTSLCLKNFIGSESHRNIRWI